MLEVCAPRGAFERDAWPADVRELAHAFVAEDGGVLRVLLLTSACVHWRATVRALAHAQPMTQLAFVLLPGESAPVKPPLVLDWVLESITNIDALRTQVAACVMPEAAFALPAHLPLSWPSALHIITCTDALFADAAHWFRTQFEHIGVHARSDAGGSSSMASPDALVLGIGSMAMLEARLAAVPGVMLALTEQLTSASDSFASELAVRAKCIFVPSIIFVRAARGMPAIAAKMCVMPYLWTSGRSVLPAVPLPGARGALQPALPRQKPAVQFGWGCPRRLAVHTTLEALDVPVRYETAVYGDAKRAMLTEAAVVYVPHFYPPPVFTPIHRLSEVIPYGCTLVCEHSQDVLVDQLLAAVGGVHFVSYDALVPVTAELAARHTIDNAMPASPLRAWTAVISYICGAPILNVSGGWFKAVCTLAAAQ